MPSAPKPPPKPEPGSDADLLSQGKAPTMDPKNPKPREVREAEAFAALGPEAAAAVPDQMKPPPLPPEPPS